MHFVYDTSVYEVSVQVIGQLDTTESDSSVRLEKKDGKRFLWLNPVDTSRSLKKALAVKNLKSIAFPIELYYEYANVFHISLRESPNIAVYICSPQSEWSDFFESLTRGKKVLPTILRELPAEVYPPKDKMFECLNYFSPEDTRVVIFGQDPYHSIKGQAMGLCFSVPEGFSPPPSLQNIYKELKNEGFTVEDESSGDLMQWAKQGVLLLNTALTVIPNEPLSHVKLWEPFTEALCKYIDKKSKGCVILCFGNKAKAFAKFFSNKHSVISTAHPSPLSAHNGFFGSSPFSRCNALLKHMNRGEIDWNL